MTPRELDTAICKLENEAYCRFVFNESEYPDLFGHMTDAQVDDELDRLQNLRGIL